MMKFSKIITAFALSAFIAVGVFGMMGMEGHHHEPGCPFMPGENVICQMDVFDHISAWQHMFTSVVPSLVILLLSAAVVVFVGQRKRPPDIPILSGIRNFSRQKDIPNLYQQLFSKGILNPKIP